MEQEGYSRKEGALSRPASLVHFSQLTAIERLCDDFWFFGIVQDSIAAFKYAISNIYKPGDVVTLLHVLSTYCDSPASGSVFYAYNSWDPEIDQTLRHQVEDFLDQEFVHPAASQGINVNVVLVLEHSRRPAVGRIVCKKAEELQAEPLVLATHRKGYLQGLVVGSVSHYCAKHCKQPVLLVQPDKDI